MGKRKALIGGIILLLLISVDIWFIYMSTTVDLGQITYTADGQPYALTASVDPRWMLEGEGGYSEGFQYVKEALIALILLAVFVRTGSRMALVGVAIFGYIVLDDWLGMHERVGALLKQNAGGILPLLFRWQNLNEAMVFGAVGVLFLLLAIISYLRGSLRERTAAHIFAGLLVLLVLCGVGFDVIHAVFDSWSFLPILEDGGEMVVMSGFLVAALGVLMSGRSRAPQQLGSVAAKSG